MASFENAKTKVVNAATPELIGRTLVPFFLSSGEDDKVNEKLHIPKSRDDFRSVHVLFCDSLADAANHRCR